MKILSYYWLLLVSLSCSNNLILPSESVEAENVDISLDSNLISRAGPTSHRVICPVGPCITPPVTFCCVEITGNETIGNTLNVNCQNVTNNLIVNDELDIFGNLVVETNSSFQQNVHMFANLCVNQDATIGGNELLLGSLTVNNGATINGTSGATVLTVDGNQQNNGNLTATGNGTVEQNLTVVGDTLMRGTLTELSTATFEERVTMNQNLHVEQNLLVLGNEILQGILNVSAGVIINGPTGCLFTINGSETINGSLTVNGNETVGQNLTVGGASTLNGLVTANSGLQVTNGETITSGGLNILNGGANITGNFTVVGAGNIVLAQDKDVLADLTVDEDAFLNNVIVNGPLSTVNLVTMNDGLTIASGNETLTNGNLTVSSGNLFVGGTSNFDGLLTANNGVTLSKGLVVIGGQSINGSLIVQNCGNVIVGGSATIGGTLTGLQDTTLAALTLTGTTNSTAPTNGTLVVNGGVGIAQDLYIGGNEFFPTLPPFATVPGTPAPLNYYEQTCFSTGFHQFDPVTNDQASSASITIQLVRIGNLVNMLIPPIILDIPIPMGGVVTSNLPLPFNYVPPCTVRGASSTIVTNPGASGVTGLSINQLGEFEINNIGFITFGIPGPLPGPQPFASPNGPAQVDANTITYNLLSCGCGT